LVPQGEKGIREKGRMRIVCLKDARTYVFKGKKCPSVEIFQFAFNVEMPPFFSLTKLVLLA